MSAKVLPASRESSLFCTLLEESGLLEDSGRILLTIYPQDLAYGSHMIVAEHTVLNE